ncbi:MAG: hypothetical protein ACP5F3_00180 [Candidatus Syntrophosphaera sp.]
MSSKPAAKYNKLCERCLKSCKQPASVVIITCPDFEPRSVQLTIPLKFPRGRPKKTRK